MEHVIKSATLPYTAQSMYDLVNDITNYPEFLPWCQAAKIIERHDHEITASLTLSKGGVHKSFTTRNELTPHKQIEMHLVNGPFKHLHGLWQFTETDASHCHIQVDLSYAFDSRIIAMMIGPVFGHIANTLLQAFIDRAHELHA